MTTAKLHRKIGTLALGLSACAFCFLVDSSVGDSATFNLQDLEKGANSKLRGGETLLAAAFGSFPLEKLPVDLGDYFPLLKQVHLVNTAVSKTSPTVKQKRGEGIDACKKVKRLSISHSPGSLATFEWINVFFPNVDRLWLRVEGLPIQQGAPYAGKDQLEVLKMRNVKYLYCCGDAQKEEHRPPLFENLELFPSLTTLDLHTEPLNLMLETMVQEKRRNRSVKNLGLYGMPISTKLLGSVMEVFPLLEELSISGENFCKLTRDVSWTDLLNSPFERLLRLQVDLNGAKDVHFNSNMASVFPSVSDIVLKSLSLQGSSSLSGDEAPNTRVTWIKLISPDPWYPLSSLGVLFPNVNALSISSCGSSTIFSNNASRDKDFFARLTYLNLAGNPTLCHILAEELQEFHIRLNAEPGPLAPNLKTLDIRGSFHISKKTPGLLSQYFPDVTRLKISNDAFDNSANPDESELREFLESFTKLANLDIELSTSGQPPDESMIRGILSKVGKKLNSHIEVKFFARRSPKPILSSESGVK